jgi:hypothetical protein
VSDLKSFLWNSRTPTSEKHKYSKQNLRLTEWPDFGFVGCPKDYIVLSAYLVKHTMSYETIQRLTGVESKVLNHFIYVCRMIGIIQVTEPEKRNNKERVMKLFKNDFSVKLKAMFF